MTPMELSVIIPTCGRPDQLVQCCAGLARQDLTPGRFEVLIGVDGPDSGERAAALAALPHARIFEFPKGGPGLVRNGLLAHCRAPITLMLNDDVVPDPACLELHLRAHRELAGRPAMVLGAAPWKIRRPDRLFDKLVRSSSMVFFYNRMTGDAARDPMHDWGFRHAWTLNLSVPTTIARLGFNPALGAPCYEDLEWAFNIRTRWGVPVLYRPGAVVLHDHRYEPEGYLRREETMGREACRLARVNPACARAIFGRDILAAPELAYAAEWVRREERSARELSRTFGALAGLSAEVIGESEPVLEIIYQHHLPLKRWFWNRGLLGAASGVTAWARAG
ncbi:MAG: glycosyltransferase [Phycisphaerales bacterium]|nr:glycosyltransferase [Phycisphaerales bacterium]